MGEIVHKKDPELKKLSTQWFLHYELTEDPERAEAWHYFARQFLPNNNSFSKKDLLNGLTQKLRAHSERHFGPGSKLNQVILRKIIECYTEDYALGSLALLRKEGNHFVRGKPNRKQGPWESTADLKNAYLQK
jgi:hypothetical protein